MATIVRGVAIRPGVSLNKRRYKPEVLAKSNEQLAARLADPKANPATMRLFHPKPNGQDATVAAIAGRLTKVTLQADGAIAYEGVLNDTEAGKTAGALATPDADGRQHLGSVSIRGYATGALIPDADGIVTPETLEIVGLDFTDDPGVVGATTTASTEALEADEAAGRHLLHESVENSLIVDSSEAKPVTPGASDYADPGYQKDKKPRYPVDTKAHALAAWSYINKASNAKPYTSAQLKRIKGKVKAALKKFGVDASSESCQGHALTESLFVALADEASSYLSTSNGDVDLQLSSYGVHPSKLAALVAAHAKAAGAAFASLDPDNDGDIDGVTDDDDSQSCSSCGEPMDSDARYCPACSYPAGETNTPQTTTEVDASADPKEPVMGEPTAEAAKAAEEARQAAATEQAAAITKAVTEGIAAGLAADRAARAEETVALEAKAAADKKAAEEAAAAAAVTEAATAELRASIRKELLAEQRNAGRPVRKGVVRVIDEAYDPSTLTRAERDEVLGDTLVHRLFPHLENSIA